MSETVVVTGTPAPESTETVSTERVIGQLETETEHLAETVQEVEETAEAAESRSETAIDIAGNAAETAWAAKSEVESLRSEMQAGFAEILTRLEESEDLEDTSETANADSAEIVDDSPAPEETAEETPAPKRNSMLRRILYGRT